MTSDKLKHLYVGCGLGFVFGGITGFVWGLAEGSFYGIAVALMAGIVKEAIDKETGSGTPEFMDIVATFIGGVIGTAIVIFLVWVCK